MDNRNSYAAAAVAIGGLIPVGSTTAEAVEILRTFAAMLVEWADENA